MRETGERIRDMGMACTVCPIKTNQVRCRRGMLEAGRMT